MSKFIEVSDKFKKYFINVDNILSLYQLEKDGYKTRILLKESILIFNSNDTVTKETSMLVIESYAEIKNLIVQ